MTMMTDLSTLYLPSPKTLSHAVLPLNMIFFVYRRSPHSIRFGSAIMPPNLIITCQMKRFDRSQGIRCLCVRVLLPLPPNRLAWLAPFPTVSIKHTHRSLPYKYVIPKTMLWAHETTKYCQIG